MAGIDGALRPKKIIQRLKTSTLPIKGIRIIHDGTYRTDQK